MLTSLKCLRALVSYYGRQMACRPSDVSRLISSGHEPLLQVSLNCVHLCETCETIRQNTIVDKSFCKQCFLYMISRRQHLS